MIVIVNFFRKVKDSILLYLCSHLIHKSPCSNCNISYYGETESHLNVRAGEHISTSQLQEKGSITTKYFSLKITSFCQVTCIDLIIFSP